MEALSQSACHYPVMLREVLKFLDIKKDGTYIDSTYGNGGYTKAILDKGARSVIGIDQDPEAATRSQNVKKKYGDSFTFLQGSFKNLKELLESINVRCVDGIVFDLGVSSPQLDQATRGFSFQKEGPLDMRMSKEGKSAADAVYELTEKELANIFWQYGEEKKSYKIAKSIVKERATNDIKTTTQLADIIKGNFSQKEIMKMKIHPATKCFQALRIYINDELSALETALNQSVEVLKNDGVLVVVSFHSLEDRIVKNFIKKQSGQQNSTIPKDLQQKIVNLIPLTKKPTLPSEEECLENPRSRSAKLRSAKRYIEPK